MAALKWWGRSLDRSAPPRPAPQTAQVAVTQHRRLRGSQTTGAQRSAPGDVSDRGTGVAAFR